MISSSITRIWDSGGAGVYGGAGMNSALFGMIRSVGDNAVLFFYFLLLDLFLLAF